ncbi:hypothetical protein ENUP19_0082G0051 [Entamoeba nuttalli]|uniref:Uncharacterized protein n=2 Tax=Entamoeba nuttalli TaxID=412467 RepID=K2HCB5_ENTNP|nr:hypothetical protein ENU1_092080 [Entamoeba nuttalli P19]EKE40369.1 hypothetical protein ENU1_092080 [Entamoeba nuttalli P19]|eukprot:XP_008857282.1 hypothetical protein ENU1_092080 [Entamoeba nuttalli P19]
MSKQQSNSPVFPLGEPKTFQDTISGIEGYSSQNGILIGVSSWDKTCKAFLVNSPTQTQIVGSVNCNSPLTSICKFRESQFLVGSLNGGVYLWNVQQNSLQQVGQFNDCITSMKPFLETNSIVISSLDGSLGLLDLNSGNISKMPVNNKIICMDAKYPYITFHTPNKVEVFNMQSGKLMTDTLIGGQQSTVNSSVQCIAVFPDRKGIVYGGADGRANVLHFENKSNQYTYAFKAQHKKISTTQTYYYPVNSISFYNETIFLTAGSDGVINIWDKNKKSLVNTLTSPIQNCPITTADFICENKFLAYSVGYDWHQGVEGLLQQQVSVPVIKVVDDPLVRL